MHTETNSHVRVFVVDDDHSSRESVCAVVQSAGFTTESFESGEAFLAAYDQTRAGCLISDYRLKGITGLDVHRQLRERGSTLPVIVVSGFADVPIAVQAMRQGVVTLLQKPYHHAELLEAVREAITLDHQRREQQQLVEQARAKLQTLSDKERQVLDRMLEGKPNKVVARELNIGLRTVERRRHAVFTKMGAESVVQLAEMTRLAEA